MTSPPDRLRKPNDGHVPWLLRRIWDRIHRDNEHFMGVIVGREGSGKSYTAIKIAHEVDPSFSAERVIFDVASLLEELKSGRHEPGNFYVLDEAGVQLGRRTWAERGQVLANQALQLIRNHNLGLIFTLPRLSELDSQAVGRLQAFLELTDKEDGEYVTGKWKFLDPDRADTTGKVYRYFPRRRTEGQLLRVTSVAFRPPPADLVEPYEERKSEFQQQFYEETIGELRDEEDGDDGDDGPDLQELAASVVDDELEAYVDEHSQNGRRYVDKSLLRVDHDLSKTEAQTVKSLIEREVDLDEVATNGQTDTTPTTGNSD